VEFLKLSFQGRQFTSERNISYTQHFVRVAMDTTHAATQISVDKPHRSRATADHLIEGHSQEVGWMGQIGGSIKGILGLPTLEATAATARTTKTTSCSQVTRYSSRITQHDCLGVAWWGFSVEDAYDKENGIEMVKDHLPTVDFEFLAEDGLAPAPQYIDVEVASYWTLGRGLTSIIPGKRPNLPPYSNLCQVAVVKLPSNLQESHRHISVLNVCSGSRPEARVQPILQGSLQVSSVVCLAGDPKGKSLETGKRLLLARLSLPAAETCLVPLREESLLDLPTLRKTR
jgi:hypothetical protein